MKSFSFIVIPICMNVKNGNFLYWYVLKCYYKWLWKPSEPVTSWQRTFMIMADCLPKWQIRQNLQPNSVLFKFLCILLRFDGQKHEFSQLFLWLWPMFRLAWPSDMHFEKKNKKKQTNKKKTKKYTTTWFWPPTVWFIFTPMEAKYTHLDNSITCLTTIITTNTYCYTVDASKIM